MLGTDLQAEFLLAEYGAVREEVKWIISQTEAVENLALATSGAIWGWLLTQEWNQIHSVGIWLALLVSLLFGLKRLALRNSLDTVRNFILRVEVEIGLRDELNYESYLKESQVAHFKIWRKLFWPFLLVGNFGLASALILRAHSSAV